MKEQIIEKWQEILDYFSSTYNVVGATFDTFISPITVYDLKDNLLVLVINNPSNGSGQITKDFIERNFELFIQLSIEKIIGVKYDIQFILSDEADKLSNESKQEIHLNRKKQDKYPFLNPNYTFDSFVIGGNNEFAHAAALAVAENPADAYNPLFIYGGVGLGKTHLMHAIANHIIDHNENANVIYVTSETFTNEVIEAIRHRRDNTSSMQEFRNKYRNSDVLLIDDIQFIIGKDSTQEEFFHTFNHLYENNKQIVISSDKPPSQLEILEERLRSRFSMGLPADIKSPNFETRVAILKKKAEPVGLTINDDVLSYIAENIESNIRELEGAITKIIAFSRLKHKEINMDLAMEALQDMINPNKKRQITVDYIMEIVADHYNITVEDIISKKRSNDIAYPRQICMYLCRKLTTVSLTEIGKKLGKDHSTIIHGYEKIEANIETDASLASNIETLKKKINPQ